MKRAVLAASVLLGGCVYLNTLYNARTYYREAERARLGGETETAAELYRTALEKARASFVRDSLGGWADPALLVLGQASFRLGMLPEARLALERAYSNSRDPDVRSEAGVYLGAVLAASGDHRGALGFLNEALRETRREDLRGEGHMWRARILLARGEVDQGWWDLERAVEEDPRLDIPASLERLVWALASGDRRRAAQGALGLLQDPRGGLWVDSLSALAAVTARAWSPGDAAELLAPVRGAPWAPAPREQLLLQRIDLLMEAGDTLAAETELGWVGQGAGPGAARARMAIAGIRLRQVDDPAGLESVRRVLLPAATDSAVFAELEALRVMELLADPEVRSFPTLFAAGELARDRLGAPSLARGFFLAAARDSAAGPWRGKAALAALTLGPDDDEAAALRLALLRQQDPYLARARNRYLPSDTLAALDGALQTRLDSVRVWALAEARRRDVLVRSRAGGN